MGNGSSCRTQDGISLVAGLVREGPLFSSEVLAQVLEVLQGTADLRDGSDELSAAVANPAQLYHLSSERANVLRTLPFLSLGQALEIGSECGAVTRFLGENATQVLSIETDAVCAAVARRRCADLPNVTIASILSLPPGREDFDFVLINGGAERVSNLEDVLGASATLLAPDGAVMLTAANRTSLESLTGDGEHCGIVLRDLASSLTSAGFAHFELLHPFPGWQFPRLVIPAGAFCADSDGVVANLLESQAEDAGQLSWGSFQGRALWGHLIGNGAGSAVASAFAIIAYKTETPRLTISHDTTAYFINTRRRRCFQKLSTFVQNTSGIAVQRKRLFDNSGPDIHLRVQQVLQDEPFLPGILLSTELYRSMDRPGWVFEDILGWARRYAGFLELSAIRSGDASEPLLPPEMLDCTPFNIVVQPDGRLRAFDLEWIAPEPQPLVFVLFRGLLYTLLACGSVAQCGSVPTLFAHEIVRHLIRNLAYPFDPSDIENCWRREKEFQIAVTGLHKVVDRSGWEAVQLYMRRSREEVAALRRAGADLSRPFPMMSAELDQLRARLARKDAVLDLLRLEHERLNRTVARADRKVLRLKNHIFEERRRLAEMKVELEEARRAEAAHQTRIAEGEKSREELELSARLLNDQLSTATAQIEQLERDAVLKVFREAARPRPVGRPMIARIPPPVRSVLQLCFQLPRNPSGAIHSILFWLVAVARCVNSQRYRATRTFVASELFDSETYLQRNRDVADSRIEPLAHYLAVGEREGRSPSALFDEKYYRSQALQLDSGGLAAFYHFLMEGGRQGHSPSKDFDAAFYLGSYPDVAQSGVNPLLHYLQFGAREGRNPAPWFDTANYLAANPDVAASGVNPLLHYLRQGRREGRALGPPRHSLPAPSALVAQAAAEPTPRAAQSASPQVPATEDGGLFDREYYLRTYPEVSQSGMDPFAHYLSIGAAKGYDPHPLFHTRFYLESNEDVRKAGVNPLLHYVSCGASEGRAPNPVFNTAYYLQQCPELRGAGINPLRHYLDVGAEQGRNPNPLFNTVEYRRRYSECRTINPLVHYFSSAGTSVAAPETKPEVIQQAKVRSTPEQRRIAPRAGTITVLPIEQAASKDHIGPARPLVICISHVSGWPPRAGNDYRVYRMLTWMERHGYPVVLLAAPLPGEDVSDEHAARLAQKLSGVAVCDRDGLVRASPSLMPVLETLNGMPVPPASQELREEDRLTDRERQLLNIDRTFCHDALIAAVRSLTASCTGPCVVLAEYIFMSRVLPLIDGKVLKLIDTIDVFSTKHEKVVQHGISDSLAMSDEEERVRLSRADVVLAIQSAERDALRAIVPDRDVVTVGVDFDVLAQNSPALWHSVFYVASDNAMNVKGLEDFLRFAWPWIQREVPDARLRIAGKVCSAVQDGPSGVELLGPVEDLTALYREAKLAINPAIAGTGLKIKTVEALCHLRPIVTWPAGVDGMEAELAKLCQPVTDWRQFSRQVVEILSDPRREWFSHAQEELIRRHLAAEHVYSHLDKRLKAFFGHAR
jgi:hypothetical protein